MRALGIVAAAALAAGAAEGATVTFRVAGLCETNCVQVGSFENEAVGGTVTLDDAGFTPGGPIEASAFVDFVIDFGDVGYGPGAAPVVDAAGVWGESPDDPGLGLRLAAGPAAPELGAAFSFSVAMPGAAPQFLATLHGVCVPGEGGACASIRAEAAELAAASRPAVRVALAPIPAPPALGLLFAGIAVLGLVARRRARGQAAAAPSRR